MVGDANIGNLNVTIGTNGGKNEKQLDPNDPKNIAEWQDRVITARDKQLMRINAPNSRKIFDDTNIKTNNSETVSIFKAAFQSHAISAKSAVSHSGLPSRRGKKKAKRLFGTQNLHAKLTLNFHSKSKYIAPFRKSTPSSDIISDENHKTSEYLFKRLAAPKNKENSLFLITGEIGCGKSTLLSNVVFKIFEEQIAHKRGRPTGRLSTECAVIDFESIKMPGNLNFDDYLANHVEPFILQQVNDQTNLKGENWETILQASLSVNLVLAFDNMDAIYHKFCSSLLVDGNNIEEFKGLNTYFSLFYLLIEEFAIGKLSKYGIKCLFALRTDTLEVLENSHGPDHGGPQLIQSIENVISIREADSNYLRDVLERRLILARDCAKDNCRELFEQRIAKLKENNIDFSGILDVSVQGLRHTIKVISDLDPCIDNETIFERFFCEKQWLKMFFYVSGKEYYSQINQGITNIFLVNNRYRKSQNPETLEGERLFSDKQLRDHPHTYWLKYLILHLVDSVSTDKETIESLFSKTGAYDKNLVNLVLFSLSEVRHGRLVRPKLIISSAGKVNGMGLEVTNRGKRLFKGNYFWSFFYLSMVVEDAWIEIPNVLREDFQNPIGFGFLGAKNSKTFDDQFTKFMKEKIKNVFLFISILQESNALERKMHKNLFQTLIDKGVKFPNFNEIRQDCAEEVRNSIKQLSFSQQSSLTKVLNRSTNPFFRYLQKIKIRKAISPCYQPLTKK